MTAFDHLSIGRTAMQAFRLGMNIAGYNVANANTPGFSRRRVDLTTLPVIGVRNGLVGMGVDVAGVHRLRDNFLDFAYRREIGRLGTDKSREEILSGLEPLLGQADNATLSTALSGLFDSFETLSAQPDSPAVRANVILKAQEVARTFQRVDKNLVEARRNADVRVSESVKRINEILDQLKQSNLDILQQEAGGAEASDLRDQRDRLLDELGELLPITTVEKDNGQVTVMVEGTGDALLSGVSPHHLTTTQDAEGMLQVQIDHVGTKLDITASMRGGKLGGYLKARDEDLQKYRASLDALATEFVTQFNAVHSAGFDLNGNPGQALFLPNPPTGHVAAVMTVNPNLVSDYRLLAAASAAGAPGNNGNALAFVGLRAKVLPSLGGLTLGDYSAEFVADIGRDVKSVTASMEGGQAVVDALQERRQQISGVSMDEEAANLVRWQQSFQAAARFLQTANSVIDTVLNTLGAR